MTNADTGVQRLLRHFAPTYLPTAQRSVAMWFQDLAVKISNHTPEGPEKTVALRKLLEAHDCCVRATVGPAEASRAGR